MFGLGLSIPDLTIRRRSAASVVPVTSVVIEGDSITSTTPDQSTNRGDFYSYVWADTDAGGRTVHVNARASRTVGGVAYNGDGADNTGSPSGNTMLLNSVTDQGYAPQLLTTLIGANDLGTFATATYIQRLIDWATPLRSAGIKIAYSPPLPYSSVNPPANYTNFTTRRTALYGASAVRNPAVWGQWADIYIPLGEHPDFADTAQQAALINPGDGIHPTGPVATASTGQARMYALYKAAMRALVDITRVNSTTMFSDVWPASETSLATSTAITRRFIVSGLAHAGTALGASVSGGSAQIRVNGGAYGTTIGTGSGDGWRLYNGDVIDLKITTSASNSTAVSTNLTIGSETRTLIYTTVAASTPISITGAGSASQNASTTSVSFGSVPLTAGVVVLMLTCYSTAGGSTDSKPAGLTVTPTGGGSAVTATLVHSGGRAASRALAFYVAQVPTAGNWDVTGTRPAAATGNVLAYQTLLNADPTPVSTVAVVATANESDPHLTGSATVPSGGAAIGGLLKENANTGTCNSPTTLLSDLAINTSGNTAGVLAGYRTTTGQLSFNNGFGTWGRLAVVFKALGT